MNINGSNATGYYGWAAQGESEYFFKGKVNENIITGRKYSLFDGKMESMIIKLVNSSLTITTPIGKESIPLNKAEIFDDTKL